MELKAKEKSTKQKKKSNRHLTNRLTTD